MSQKTQLNKTIEITIGDVVDLVPLIIQLGEYPFVFKAKYRLSRSISKLLSEKKRFEKIKMEIFKTYGSINKEGNYVLDSENLDMIQKVSDELQLLKEEKITVDVFPVLLSEISVDINGKPIEISATVLAKCDDFIVNDTEFLAD